MNQTTIPNLNKVHHAAVKIYDLRQEKEVIIPCHRHCDAFQILHDLGYKIGDFKTLSQGFLVGMDDRYVSRTEAYDIAWNNHQLSAEEYSRGKAVRELFSEDVW